MKESERFIDLLTGAHKALIAELGDLAAEEGINRGELPVLVRLFRDGDGISQKALQEDLELSKSTVSKTVNSLIERGLLRKERSDADGRVRLIYLTDRGRELDEPVRKIGQRATERMLQGFDPEEKEELAEYLGRITANLRKS
ncbi:MAG: MarR family winged helix-turn-helix transcriptional regulator [Halodesulfurarchaeum sp.]